MTFGNEASFPRRITTASNLIQIKNVEYQCKHYKLLTLEIRSGSHLMVLIKVNSNQSSSVNSGTNDSSRIVTHQSLPAKEYRSKSTIEKTGKGLKYVQTYL